ncbi:hypothetical protein K7432_015477 [Basidiobolus ranarum]|uniref:NodB homology domain-containing protein n=1 Tax=Basidiobolus ranarum TaxID=34480 RepID=A0ABR2WG10_9FUNG
MNITKRSEVTFTLSKTVIWAFPELCEEYQVESWNECRVTIIWKIHANKQISCAFHRDEGHQIASHTNNHADLNKLSVDQTKREMQITKDVVKKVAGVVPTMMRPPFGNGLSMGFDEGMQIEVIL